MTITSSPSPVGHLRRALRRVPSGASESLLLLTIVVVGAAITLANPAFLTLSNAFDILRLVTVEGIFALGVLLVLISGGVDVSFPAVANVSAFMVAHLFLAAGFDGPGWVYYLLAVPLGVAMGLVNGFFVGRFAIPALIVTLGSSSLFYGAALFFLGGAAIFDLPAGTIALSRATLVQVPSATGAGTVGLQPLILLLVVLAVATWLLLNRSTLGRMIYAVGGDAAVAERSGVNVRRVQSITYAIAGGLAAIGGVTYATLYRSANPVSLQGSELGVIAAVVLGGALITGGRGTVLGAMLGVLLITMVENSLVLVGIPTTWQQVAVGVVLVIGIAVPAWRTLRARRTGGRRAGDRPADPPPRRATDAVASPLEGSTP